MRKKKPKILQGYVHSDDLANWENQGHGLDESEVPGMWLDLVQGGVVIGKICLTYEGGWQIKLDGGDKPFSVQPPSPKAAKLG